MASFFSSSLLRSRLSSIITRSPICNIHRTMSNSVVNSPSLMLPPTFIEAGGDMNYNLYSLGGNKVVSLAADRESVIAPYDYVDHKTKIVGSSHGWLALFNQRNCDLILTNPNTRRHVQLPPIHSLPIPRDNLESGCGCVSKVIISCDAEHEDCRAMMIFNPEDGLASCCLGPSPTEWTPLVTDRDDDDDKYNFYEPYEDVVYSSKQKLFFCLRTDPFSTDLVLEGWDVGDPPRLCWLNEEDDFDYGDWLEERQEALKREIGLWFTTSRNLVIHNEQMFVVTRHVVEQMAPDGSAVNDEKSRIDRYPYKTIGFDVHKINRDAEEEEEGLSYLEDSLDGLAMFVGLNHSFAVSATAANGLQPNSIYFTDERLLSPSGWRDDVNYGGHDIGIFDYQNKTISPCYYPCDVQSFKRIIPAPIWFTPTLPA